VGGFLLSGATAAGDGFLRFEEGGVGLVVIVIVLGERMDALAKS
jgi:hypothetical protein